MGFYLLQNDHYLNKKTQCADRFVVSDVTYMPVCCYMYCHMFFMTQCYPLNNNNSYDKAFCDGPGVVRPAVLYVPM